MESEGVVALVMPRTGLTLALMSGTLLAPGVLATPPSSSPNVAKTRKIVKQTTSTSPTRPPCPAPRSRLLSPPRRLRSESPPGHTGDRSRRRSDICVLRNVDARYMDQLKSYFQKITSSKSIKNNILPTCSAYECPLLQDRLHKHRQCHHSPDDGQHQNPGEEPQEFGNLSAPPSPQPRRSSLKSTDLQGTSAQARLTFSDLGRIAVSTAGRRSQKPPLEGQRVQAPAQATVRDDFRQPNNIEGQRAPVTMARPPIRHKNGGIKFIGADQTTNQNNNSKQRYNNNNQGSPGSNRRVSRSDYNNGNAKNGKEKGTRQTNRNTEIPNKNYTKLNQYSNTSPNNAKYSDKYSNTRPQNHQVIATDPENKTYNENYSQVAPDHNLNTYINASPKIKNTIDEARNRSQGNQNYQNNNEIVDNVINSNTEDNNLRSNAVDEFNADNNQIPDYKYAIQDQVKEWLLKVPFYPTDNPGDLIIQENAVNELVDSITNLISAVDKNGYEAQVAKEVNKCLDALNLWFPEDRRDQIKFKRAIRDQLLDKIFDVNKLYMKDLMIGEKTNYNTRAETSKSNNRYTYTVKSDQVCECKGGRKCPKCSTQKPKCDKICVTCNDEIENEITDWLNRVLIQKVNDTGQVSKRVITDSFMQRLAPYFDKPSSENCKQVLTEEIKTILHELNVGTSLVGNRKQYINRFAEDLANRLIGIHTRVECSGAGRQKWSKNTSYLVQSGILDINNSSIVGLIKTEENINNKSITEKKEEENNSLTRSRGHKNELQKNISDGLRKELLEEVKDCLASTSQKNNISLGKDILDVLIDQIDSISNGKDEVAKTEIANLLQRSNDLTYNLVDKILDNILNVIIVANNQILKVKSNDDEDLLTVYASEKELIKAGTSLTAKSYCDNNNDIDISHTRPSVHKQGDKDNIIGGTSLAAKSFGDNNNDINVRNTPHTRPSAHKPGNKENKISIETISEVIKAWLDSSASNLHGIDQNFKEIMVYDLSGDIVDRINQYGYQAILNDVFKAYIRKWLVKFKVCIDERSSKVIEPLIKSLRKECQNTQNPLSETENLKEYASIINYTNNLENNILEWLDQQPSNIFKVKDMNVIRQSVDELAQNINTKLHIKHSDVAIQEEIAKWLLEVINCKEKHNIAKLTRSLSYKLSNYLYSRDRDLIIVASAEVNKNKESKKKQNSNTIVNNSSKEKKKSSTNTTGAGSQTTSEKESKSSQVGLATSQHTDQHFEPSHDGIMMEIVFKYVQLNHDVDDPTARNAISEVLVRELKNLSLSSRKEIYENLNTSPFSRESLNVELQYVKDISEWLKNIPIETSYNTIGNKKRVYFIIDLAKLLTETTEKIIKLPPTVELKMFISGIICSFIHKLPIIEGQRENSDLIINQLVSKIESRKPLVQSMLLNKIQENPPNVIKFIDTYVQSVAHEITDELTLEAWSARVIKEVKKLIYAESPESFSKTQVYDRLANVNERNDAVKLFNLELDFCKEISYWLKNLHLHYTNGTEKVHAVTELAKKMAELKTRSSDSENTDLREYITKWINRLPLDAKQQIDIPTSVQQLINRMNLAYSKQSMSRRESKSLEKSSNTKKTSSLIPPKCKSTEIHQNTETVINVVNNFCNSLPSVSGVTDEEVIKSARENIARKLYQKIGEMSQDPHFFRNDLLYEEVLGEELDVSIHEVNNVLYISEEAKNKLLTEITAAKKNLKRTAAGQTYFETLEHVIDLSMPNPIPGSQVIDPGFEIYKQSLATTFILENFDHGDETLKMQCINKIKEELDKFCIYAKRKNALPIDKDQIFNELYSAMDKVPLPNEITLAQEVEELKTKCEIKYWFENLPLEPAKEINESLDREKIITTLSKRVHHFLTQEKDNPAEKINKEIVKWLKMLPLQGRDNNIDIFANDLQNKLKISSDKRNTLNKENQNPTKSDKKMSSKTDSTTPVYKENESKNSKSRSQISKNSGLDKKPENINGLVTKTQTNRANNSSTKENQSRNSSGVTYDNQSHLQVHPVSTGVSYNQSGSVNLTGQATYGGSNNTDTTRFSNQMRKTGNNGRVERISISRTSNNTQNKNQSVASSLGQNQSSTSSSPGDLLLKNVEELCNKIPFPINTPQDQQKANEIKDDLVTIILRKVSELNGDDKVFNDDALYGYALDVEIERILSKKLPSEVPIDRNVLKEKFLESIKSIKHLLRRSNTDNDFRKDLLDVAAKVIGDPGHKSSTNKVFFEKLTNDVVDNFLEYEYEKRSEDNKKVFKENIHHTLTNYMKSVQKSQHVDTILRTNQIICELAKIPPPDNNTLKNEVIEVRMKNAIGDLLEELFPNASIDRKLGIDKIKQSLVKRLEQIDMSSGKKNDDEKLIQKEVTKTLKQLNVSTTQGRLKELTKKLKNLMKEIQVPINQDYLAIPGTSRTTDTRESGFTSRSQFSPSQNVYANNMSFDQGGYAQTNLANPGDYGGFDPLLSSTFQGGYLLGPDDTPGNLPDSTLSGRGCDPQCTKSPERLPNTTIDSGSRPGWQYSSGYGTASPNPGSLPNSIDNSGGYVGSLPDTTVSSKSGPNRQYTSGYGPGGNQNPGTLSSSIINGTNIGSLPNSTINTTHPGANWQYVSGYGPGGSQTPGSLLSSTNDTRINEMSRTYQGSSFGIDYTSPDQVSNPGWQYTSGYGAGYIAPESLPSSSGARSVLGTTMNSFGNQGQEGNAQNSAVSPGQIAPGDRTIGSLPYSMNSAGQRFEYISGYGQNGQMTVGSIPDTLNTLDDVNPCCVPDNNFINQMQDSQMSRTYHSDEIFDPTANVAYQPYHYSPPSADISPISDTRYQDLLEPVQYSIPTLTEPSQYEQHQRIFWKYSGVHEGLDNSDLSSTLTYSLFNYPGHGPLVSSTVGPQGLPLDASLNYTGFNPHVQSTMVPLPMEGDSLNYSNFSPGLHSSLGPPGQVTFTPVQFDAVKYQQYQGTLPSDISSFAQPVPVQAMPNYSENLVETWNSSDSGAQAGVQEVSARVQQSNIGVKPSYYYCDNCPKVLKDCRTDLSDMDAIYSEGFEHQGTALTNNYNQLEEPYNRTNAEFQRQYAYGRIPQEENSRTQNSRERAQNYNQGGFTERRQNDYNEGGFADHRQRQNDKRSAEKGEQSSSADERDNPISGNEASDVEECLCFMPRKCLVHCRRRRPPFCEMPYLRRMRCRRR